MCERENVWEGERRAGHGAWGAGPGLGWADGERVRDRDGSRGPWRSCHVYCRPLLMRDLTLLQGCDFDAGGRDSVAGI